MNPRFMRNGLLMLVLVMGVSALLYTWLGSSETPVTKAYSGPDSFLMDVEKGEIAKVVQQGETLSVFKVPFTPTDTEPDYTVTIANCQRAMSSGSRSTGSPGRMDGARHARKRGDP